MEMESDQGKVGRCRSRETRKGKRTVEAYQE